MPFEIASIIGLQLALRSVLSVCSEVARLHIASVGNWQNLMELRRQWWRHLRRFRTEKNPRLGKILFWDEVTIASPVNSGLWSRLKNLRGSKDSLHMPFYYGAEKEYASSSVRIQNNVGTTFWCSQAFTLD